MSSSASATTADKLASAMEKIHKMDMAGESSNKGVNAIPQVHQKYAGRKRFYKHVGVVPVEDAPHLVIDFIVCRSILSLVMPVP